MSALFKPPPQFTFDKPSEWNNWKRTFLRYRTCSELTKKSEEIQIDCLIYAMGPRAEDILNQLTLSAADMKKFNKVISQLDNYFAPQTNTVFERAKLNQRVQKDGETVEQFITSLYQLADTCGYTDSIKREHIRDRIVCGIKDKTLSKELQLKADLTLSKAIELARHHELVSAQSAELNGAHQMDEVKKHQGRNNQRRHQQSSRPQQSNKPPQQQHRQQQ